MEHTSVLSDEVLDEIEKDAGPHGAAARKFAMLLQKGGSGCIQGIVESFQARGLGDVASSWITSETPQLVTPAQIQLVFGPGQLVGFAGMLDLPAGEISVRLAEWLPVIIRKLKRPS